MSGSMFDKPQEPKRKKGDIDIVSFQPCMMPGAAGGLSLVIFGLGSDNLVYLYDSKNKVWVEQ